MIISDVPKNINEGVEWAKVEIDVNELGLK